MAPANATSSLRVVAHGHLHAATTTTTRLMFDVDPDSLYFFEPDHVKMESMPTGVEYAHLLGCAARASWLPNGWSSLLDGLLPWKDGPGCAKVGQKCAISWRGWGSFKPAELQKQCESASVVAMKSIVVDTRMRVLLPIWRHEPNFAVVHILRDARGYVASYLKGLSTLLSPPRTFDEWAASGDADKELRARIVECEQLQLDWAYPAHHYAALSRWSVPLRPGLIQVNAEAFIGKGDAVQVCAVDEVRLLLGLPSLGSLQSTRIAVGASCTASARAQLASRHRSGRGGSWATVRAAMPQFEAVVEAACPELLFFDQPWRLRTFGVMDTLGWPRPPSPPSPPPIQLSPLPPPSQLAAPLPPLAPPPPPPVPLPLSPAPLPLPDAAKWTRRALLLLLVAPVGALLGGLRSLLVSRSRKPLYDEVRPSPGRVATPRAASPKAAKPRAAKPRAARLASAADYEQGIPEVVEVA